MCLLTNFSRFYIIPRHRFSNAAICSLDIAPILLLIIASIPPPNRPPTPLSSLTLYHTWNSTVLRAMASGVSGERC